MELAGYYKLPVPQTDTENCVAHNGSIIPVPGRDIMAQAWYQGGLSLMDFTDPENPFEIAFFDRGSALRSSRSSRAATGRRTGSTVASTAPRSLAGIDVFRLTPSEHLSEAEIRAAEAVMMDEFNAQLQPQVVWEPSGRRGAVLPRPDGPLASHPQRSRRADPGRAERWFVDGDDEPGHGARRRRGCDPCRRAGR